MVSDPEIFDVSKYGKLTEMTQIKYRFGILVGFSHNIANQRFTILFILSVKLVRLVMAHDSWETLDSSDSLS